VLQSVVKVDSAHILSAILYNARVLSCLQEKVVGVGFME
jgi:hypothetical protein